MASFENVEDIAEVAVPENTAGVYDQVSNEPPFAKRVRDASVLLQSNNPITYERLRNVVIDTYHRVAMRIASKKITNGTFVYNEESALEILRYIQGEQDGEARFTKLIQEGKESKAIRYSRYSAGIRSVIRRISAAELLRVIPLNSSLKFKEDSDDLIKEAYEDLDRILEVISTSSTIEEETTTKDLTLGQASLYIAYELNTAEIPESSFNIPDKDSNPPTYVEPVKIDKIVETTKELTFQANQRAFCHIYMTAQAYNADVDLITSRDRGTSAGTSAGVSLKIDKTIEIYKDDTLDTIILKISNAINSETLDAVYSSGNITGYDYQSNIIVAPEYQKPQIKSSRIVKKILYPDVSINEKRVALFSTYYKTNKLSFDTRRNSTKVDTELLTITFFTTKPNTLQTADPKPNSLDITQLRKNGNLILGIPGLVYGTGESIGELQNNSPISLFLTVSKGNVAAVSIKDEKIDPTTTEAESSATGSLANQIDTFYFALEQPFELYNPDPNNPQPGDPNNINPDKTYFKPTKTGLIFTDPYNRSTDPLDNIDNKLVLRISTSNYINEPSRLITIDLKDLSYSGQVYEINTADLNTIGGPSNYIPPNYLGEEIAQRVVDALYEEARTSNLDSNIQSTNILGAQLGDFDNFYLDINRTTKTVTAIPTTDTNDLNERFDDDSGRVQIVAFRYREQEYKAVVDIVRIPKKLWIATGNYQQRRTIWELGRRRSISIETKDLKTSAGTAAETMTDAEILNSVNASVSQTEARKSPILQSVYDKKRLLENVAYNPKTDSTYYRRPQQWLM